jgi:sulfhydrogenase subunit beta (sulfur reductase)
MHDKVVKKEHLTDLLKALSEHYELFVPGREKDFYSFTPFTGEAVLDFSNTRLSAKSLLFPQAERMFEFSLDESSEDAHILKEAAKHYPPTVVFGIRPCDARAVQLVNRNFSTPEFTDPWWAQRLAATAFIGLGCTEPSSSCFCTSVGGGPFSEEGLDVLLFDLGESLLARPVTERGEALLKQGAVDQDAHKELTERADALKAAAEEKITTKLATDKLGDTDAKALFDAPFWDDLAFACISCGACTFLCPTCWCFDILDERTGTEGNRIRTWDSCMFPLFTLHASGHNPRAQKVQRLRQRFMHKLKYYVDKYRDGVACVGCGRCIRHCPVNIDIREVLRLINSYQVQGGQSGR